jgi:hypothetical protein
MAVSISRSAWLTSGGRVSGCSTAGGVVSRTGLWLIQPHTMACLKAPDSTAWTSRMALGVMGMPCTQLVWWTRSSPLKRNRKTSPGRIGG